MHKSQPWMTNCSKLSSALGTGILQRRRSWPGQHAHRMTHTCMTSYCYHVAKHFLLYKLFITAENVSMGAQEPHYTTLSLAFTLAIAEQNAANTRLEVSEIVRGCDITIRVHRAILSVLGLKSI